MALVGYSVGVSGFPKGPYGFDNELWFSKEGYTPHYAEHIIDPLDGKEKLIMADPHTRQTAFIYNLANRRIEWEASPGGSAINNPHTARMLMGNVAGFGDAGDIYCPNRDQKIVVIDRATKTIKTTKTVPWTPEWVHETCLSVDPGHLIVTDYNHGTIAVAKVRISDMVLIWSKHDFGHPAKVNPIRGAHPPGGLHTPDYGGDYLICSNEFHGAVWEIKDSDGSWTWSRPRDRQGPSLVSPHAAFRTGRVENVGWMTIVATESGGGLIAIHFMGAPLWSIGNRASKTVSGESSVYTGNAEGLSEITHVFPTIDGRIGFIDWGGVNRANVVIMNEIPRKQHVGWQLEWNKPTTNSWVFIEYVPVADWDETWVTIKNTGGTNTLSWKILGSLLQSSAYSGGADARPEDWIEEKAEVDLAPGGAATYKLSRSYQYILVMYKSKVTDNHTTVSVYFDHKRG